jgi:hypothetical protein
MLIELLNTFPSIENTVTVPSASPVAVPFTSTDMIPQVLVNHVTYFVTLFMVPSENLPVAINVTFLPLCTVLFVDVNVIYVTIALTKFNVM